VMSQPHNALGLTYRRASGVDDFASTYELFLAAANDLRARGHRDLLDDTVARRARALAFRAHAFRHDADGFWLAEHDGERVGFGIATARHGFWHLNALHVLPAFQGEGVGSELLRRCLAYGRRRGVVSTVISEAAQPISNALYARHGMYQWMPLIHVELPSIPRDLAQTTQALTGRVAPSGDAEVLAALDRIDSSVLGFTRPVDHRFWLDLPDLTLLLLGPAPDQPTSYAYVSSFGGIGPCAAVSARDLPTLVLHSLRLAVEAGRDHACFVAPGIASSALKYLLELGGRFDASMTLLLSNRAFGHLNRYLLSASDALF
jgi:GNAT superfamily N-acetyltransferase